jgi:hypothetical protein
VSTAASGKQEVVAENNAHDDDNTDDAAVARRNILSPQLKLMSSRAEESLRLIKFFHGKRR